MTQTTCVVLAIYNVYKHSFHVTGELVYILCTDFSLLLFLSHLFIIRLALSTIIPHQSGLIINNCTSSVWSNNCPLLSWLNHQHHPLSPTIRLVHSRYQAGPIPNHQGSPIPNNQTSPVPNFQTSPIPNSQTSPAPNNQTSQIPNNQAGPISNKQTSPILNNQVGPILNSRYLKWSKIFT